MDNKKIQISDESIANICATVIICTMFGSICFFIKVMADSIDKPY